MFQRLLKEMNRNMNLIASAMEKSRHEHQPCCHISEEMTSTIN
jgi:hypothetical protein